MAVPSAASRAAVSVTTTRSTAVFSVRLASVLALRTSPRTQAAVSVTSGSPPAPRLRSSSASGQLERWTEPGCHHDQTSSVTKGRNGASRRSWVESASCSAAWAEAAASGPCEP